MFLVFWKKISAVSAFSAVDIFSSPPEGLKAFIISKQQEIGELQRLELNGQWTDGIPPRCRSLS